MQKRSSWLKFQKEECLIPVDDFNMETDESLFTKRLPINDEILLAKGKENCKKYSYGKIVMKLMKIARVRFNTILT